MQRACAIAMILCEIGWAGAAELPKATSRPVRAPQTRPTLQSPLDMLKMIPKAMMPDNGVDTPMKKELRDDWLAKNMPGMSVRTRGWIDYISVTDKDIRITVSNESSATSGTLRFGNEPVDWGFGYTFRRSPENDGRFKNMRKYQKVDLTGQLVWGSASYSEGRKPIPGRWSVGGGMKTQ